jgi:probable HAF family extracellular repeat protein
MNGRLATNLVITAAAMMIAQAAHSGGSGGADSGGGATSGGGPPAYSVDVIPGPFCGIFGYEPAVGKGINDLGHICGYNFDCNNFNEAFFWSPETGRITLNLPPGTIISRALDLNDTLVVGALDISNDGFAGLAFLHDGLKATILGTLPAGNYSAALSINTSGEIVGKWGNNLTGDPAVAGFIWQDGIMKNIELPMGPNGQASSVNDRGQVTGWMGLGFHIDSHAFIWDNGNVTDLGVIPGGFTAQGMAINNLGDVAVRGRMFNDQNEVIVRSFLWREGQWIDLGVLPGFEETLALDLNDAGQVIGRCDMLDSNASRPFLWQNGTMWDLNELWTSDDDDLLAIGLPWGMNTSGQITLQGIHQEFGSVAVRLTQILPPLGDLDGDGTVGASDLLILLTNWGPCPDCDDCPADLDGNCVVGASDLLILLVNWG